MDADYSIVFALSHPIRMKSDDNNIPKEESKHDAPTQTEKKPGIDAAHVDPFDDSAVDLMTVSESCNESTLLGNSQT